jgi:hypothetical protein
MGQLTYLVPAPRRRYSAQLRFMETTDSGGIATA